MVGANVGYYGDAAQANPVVGELYTAHLVVGVGYPPRGGVLHSTRIRSASRDFAAPSSVSEGSSGARDLAGTETILWCHVAGSPETQETQAHRELAPS